MALRCVVLIIISLQPTSCILNVEGWTKPNINLVPLPQDVRLLLPVLFGREHLNYCI